MNKYITLNPADIKVARDFAAKSVSSSLDQYARRRQTDPKQVMHQIYTGKLGEFAVCQWLSTYKLPVSTPDTTIYDARHKTFAPDMVIRIAGEADVPLHVKAQDEQSAERFGISWTFQYSATAGSDKEIFSPNRNPNAYIAFVGISGGNAVIFGMPLVSTLFEYDLFRDPKLAKLRGIKTVVYYDDFKLLPQNKQWAVNDLIAHPVVGGSAPYEYEDA